MPLSNIDDLTSDRKLSMDGCPLDLGGGRVIWVRQAGGHNRSYLTCAGAEVIDLRKILPDGEDPSPDVWQESLARIMAATLVDRWEGFEIDGAQVVYTTELGLELFAKSPDTFDRGWALATEAERFRLEADGKSAY